MLMKAAMNGYTVFSEDRPALHNMTTHVQPSHGVPFATSMESSDIFTEFMNSASSSTRTSRMEPSLIVFSV